MSEINFKYHNLKNLLKEYKKVAIAFSGGTDSFLLAYIAKQVLIPDKILLIFINHDFSPSYLKAKTIKRAQFLRIPFYSINISLLHFPNLIANSTNRCYLCKKICFQQLKKTVFNPGFEIICDGTNKTDLILDNRPGIKALNELNIKSPFCEIGLTKQDIFHLYEKLGIKKFILPPNSCLATRVKTGIKLDKSLLSKIDKAENYLIKKGFMGVRVRTDGNQVKIQVFPWQIPYLINIKKEIELVLKKIGFKHITIDKNGYRPIGLDKETYHIESESSNKEALG